jgi:aspartate/methionine/tyrosine aminotransferase
LLEKKKKADTEIIDLTESNPTSAGFDYPEETILMALCQEEALHYRPTAKGLFQARQAIADYYTKRGIAVSTEELILTSSTSEAYSFLFKLLVDPGDEILIPSPSYPLFDFLARLEGARARRYPLCYADGWTYDLDYLTSLLGNRTKGIVVVNPNNPTGSFVAADQWKILREISLSRDVPLICDEVFIDYSIDDASYPVDPAAENEVSLFILNGLSKLAGLPQLKLGWIAARGPADQMRRRMEHLEIIADTFLSVGTPVQLAGPALLASAGEVHGQIQSRIRENYHFLQVRCSKTPVECLNLQGGWYANLRLPRIRSEEEWVLHFLESADTLVHPGYFYGFPQEAYMVISLLTKPEDFQEGVSRLLREVG